MLVIANSFTRRKSCLTNLISFYDKITYQVDQRKLVDVVALDSGKAFDNVSHSILLEKLSSTAKQACHTLGEQLVDGLNLSYSK